MVTLKKFKNLVDLLTYFSDEQICRNYLEKIRWGSNLMCPYEDQRFDFMLHRINNPMSYQQLIQDGRDNNSMEAQQSSFSF